MREFQYSYRGETSQIEVIFCYFFMFSPYSGIFEVNCSKDLKIQGILGPCASLEKVP
jgi:hypothetical protein